MQSVDLLQQATIFGSAFASAKLAILYLEGFNSIEPNYKTAAAYYSIALKLILMIPHNLWEMCLLLEIIVGWCKLCRFHFHRKHDFHLWSHGIKLMKQIDQKLQDPNFNKFLTHEEDQKRQATRIHIFFCFALTSQVDCDYETALKMFQDCERIGYCGFSMADKLVKKAHTQRRLLESRVPRVQPICVQCNYEAKELKEIWKLLVCSKCQVAACCSRECLTKHHSIHKNNE